MKRAHSDEEIIRAATQKKETAAASTDNKVEIAVDLEDNHGITHTYVVTFTKDGDKWKPLQVNELSSL